MSHPARLSLRAPPHLPFIQGFPGVPGGKDRKQAAVCGTVEVRVGAQPIKAKWVRVEIRRHESLPPGFPAQGDSWELVGEIVTLWQSQGKEFDLLQTADFKFFLPLPETLPPTVEMAKNTGVWYELVAALSYKKKGGIFKADGANIMKISEPIRITKHELHAVWPVYNHTDQKSVAGQELTMTIQRPGVAFGPGDRILLTASLRSSRPIPFKLRGFECSLLEVVSSIPPPPTATQGGKRNSKPAPQKPVVKSRPIAQARCAVDDNVPPGGERSARIDMAVPPDVLVTVRNAKTLEVGYELQVKAVCDGFEGPLVPGIKYVVGQYSRSSAQQAMRDIGHVDALCGGPPRNSLPVSTPSFVISTPPTSGPPTPVPQGFVAADPRRQSTSTITTITTAERAGDFSPAPSQRPYSTVPARQTLAFPTAYPAGSPRPSSPPSAPGSDYSHTQANGQYLSDAGHTDRHSIATAGTFGIWDPTLRNNMQQALSPAPSGSSAPQPAWNSAESEKSALYNAARQQAAVTQSNGGASLDQFGLADIPDVDVAPPEYAPPVPALPGGRYQAPIRPVSAYTSPEHSISSQMPSPVMGSPASLPFEAGASGSGGLASPAIGGGRDGSSPNGIRQAVDAGPVIPTQAYGRPVATAGPSRTLPSSSSQPASGLSEKEQMRRYYEAKDRVENGGARGEGSSSAGLAVPAADIVPTPATTPMLSEKEQMRRYYEAKDRVDNQGEPSASTSNPPSVQTSSQPPAPLSEKEQMRRYYEARDRVERAQGGENAEATGSGSGSGMSASGPSGVSASTSGHTVTATASQAAAYPSATAEKDAMRRRYEEATSRVGRSGTASPAPSQAISYFPPAPAAPLSPAPPAFAAESSAGPSRATANSSAYPSATDEKERMRRLYEEANERVSRARTSMSPPPPPDPPARFASPPPIPTSYTPASPASYFPSGSSAGHTYPPKPTASSSAGPAYTSPYPSAEQEKDSMRRQYEAATSAVDRHKAGGSGSQAHRMGSGTRSRVPSEEPEAPPPPLPSRPPADYINLLSPI